MEGREGVAVAGGHESGHGLFRADITMTEAQEAGKGYQSGPSSPSTSPTPSPPPAEAGHGGDATAPPLAWSLGGDKPSEPAGDNGMQMAGQSEHANLSSGRRRGRPRGSGRRQILATLGEWYALSAGGSFTPHVIIVGTGEGRFEILQLMGSFTMAEEGRRRTGGLSVSLAGPDGRVVGGVVAGMLRAASPIQVVVGSFLPNSLKQHQRRMNLQHQPSPAPAPALPSPMAPPPVLTAAMPISQAAPGNGFHAPPGSAVPPQPHARVEHSTMNMNLNATTGFTMVGWPASSPPMAHRASPDINVSLTPQE
ncbi:hypothetical protein BAE44_0009524 [Dichanthelium oligosanthes]|uniref:AT-hook motif nuclear-localized protein n=1 Tax=Dichanthelium oligosanthes TaxID=888268 RepID=A0A1E5VWJ6_9POAL|nr:hypothetical protein BAE44_0009524 [Dichanthelium oligosanthes]